MVLNLSLSQSSESRRLWMEVLGWDHTLQTYRQSGTSSVILARASMTSRPPLDAASPPTVRTMSWPGSMPSRSRTSWTLGSAWSMRKKRIGVHPHGKHLDVVALPHRLARTAPSPSWR